MWCQPKIRDRCLIKIRLVRYGGKWWGLRGALLLFSRDDMAASTPALGKYLALADIGGKSASHQANESQQARGYCLNSQSAIVFNKRILILIKAGKRNFCSFRYWAGISMGGHYDLLGRLRRL